MTDDAAQVQTVAIFDKGQKGFQMVDTVHNSIVEETKERRIFDRAIGKPGKKDVPITNTQKVYNKIMGFVDLDDLIAWFYGCAFPLTTYTSLSHPWRSHSHMVVT